MTYLVNIEMSSCKFSNDNTLNKLMRSKYNVIVLTKHTESDCQPASSHSHVTLPWSIILIPNKLDTKARSL